MMAPMQVPVEVRRQGSEDPSPRWFRLSVALSVDVLRLRSALPDELCEGPVALRFQLPMYIETSSNGDPVESAQHADLVLTGLAEQVVVDEGETSEHAEYRLLRFVALSEGQKSLIRSYVGRRLGLDLPPADQ